MVAAEVGSTFNAGMIAVNTTLVAVTAYFLKRSLDRLDHLDSRSRDHGERISRLEGSTSSGPFRQINH